MANGTPDYTVKELLSDFVIPRLEKIEGLLGGKADNHDMRELVDRVKVLEDKSLHPAAVRELISQALQDSQARGWTTRERLMGIAVVVLSGAGLLIQAYAQFGG